MTVVMPGSVDVDSLTSIGPIFIFLWKYSVVVMVLCYITVFDFIFHCWCYIIDITVPYD